MTKRIQSLLKKYKGKGRAEIRKLAKKAMREGKDEVVSELKHYAHNYLKGKAEKHFWKDLGSKANKSVSTSGSTIKGSNT